MPPLLLSAPGKVFLTGEYAVLWGAPSIVAGVAPRMQAQLELREGKQVDLRVPGASVRGELGPSGLSFQTVEPGARFVQRALELAEPTRGFSLRVFPSPSGPRGRKLGLGTSAAAATLGAAAGLLARGEPLAPAHVFAIAAEAHWEVQGCRGSSGDVAASCWGGLTRYWRWPVELEGAERPAPRVQPLHDGGLQLALVFSGKSAKTPSMVAAVEAALTPDQRAQFVEQSTARTEAFARALEAGQHRAALDALDAAGELLAELGRQAQVPVVTPALEKLQAFGRARGLAAKVSGAGGGDSLLLASFNPAALVEALAALAASGHRALKLELSPGVRAEP